MQITRVKLQVRAVQDIESTASEVWNWIKEKAEDAEKWVIEVGGKSQSQYPSRKASMSNSQAAETVDFVVTLAGEVYRFILNTINDIGNALSWLFNKLKIAFEDLIEYLGFLFAWGDIIQTKNSLKAFMTGGLDWAAGKVDAIIPTIDQFFTNIKNDIQTQQITESDQSVDQGPPNTTEAQKSMGFNWTNYHMVHSGGASNFQPSIQPAPSDQGILSTIHSHRYRALTACRLDFLERDMERCCHARRK